MNCGIGNIGVGSRIGILDSLSTSASDARFRGPMYR